VPAGRLDAVPTALRRAKHSTDAGRATAREARLLGIALDAPCLNVVRRTFTRSAPITLARLVHPGAAYALHGEFQP
jgi:GntR family histidine utilization transcriptional repressor